MGTRHQIYRAFLLISLAVPECARAAESAFTTYGLGSAAFGAGVTPPPGTYVSLVSGFYEGEIKGPVTLGGVTLDVGMKVDFFSQALAGLYVPDTKILGGNFGLTVIVPVGHVNVEADVTGPLGNTIAQETDGWGAGDMNVRAQLGWTKGDLFAFFQGRGLEGSSICRTFEPPRRWKRTTRPISVVSVCVDSGRQDAKVGGFNSSIAKLKAMMYFPIGERARPSQCEDREYSRPPLFL